MESKIKECDSGIQEFVMKIYDKRSRCEKARLKLREDIIETESKIA